MKKIKFSKLLVGLLILGSFSACSVEEDKIEKESSSNVSSSGIIVNSSSNITSVGNNTSSSIVSSGNNNQSNNNIELPVYVQIFINNVNLLDLNNISLEDRDNLTGAYYLYSTLTDDQKQLSEVINAKNRLDNAKVIFNELYNEYLLTREAEETGRAFNEAAKQYSNVDAIIREDIEDINYLLTKYETLSVESKSLSYVIEAKSWLDAALVRVNELNEMSEDEYAAIQFIALVNKLPRAEELVYSDIEKVNAAINVYLSLSNDSKNNNNVIEAKALLDVLSEKSEHLVLVQTNAENFINMVWALPTSDQLEWKNAEHDALIKAAENAYLALTEEEKQIFDVPGAYEQLQAVRAYFDGLKEPYDISKLSFSMPWGSPINVSGKINYTCQFTYATGKDHITVLTTQYGIPREELTNHVRVYLNMYIEAGAVAGSPLYRFDITEDYSGLNNAKYVEVLKSLQAAGNSDVFSGMGICFTLNIESLNDQYASSKYSNFMAGQKIYWEE